MPHSLTGTRIRQKRGLLGLSQTALARQAGISTSYLNLIEHNKRGIAGKVLLSISRELGVSASSLTEDADSELTALLQEASAKHADQIPETLAVAEFAGRFPGWSRLLANTYKQKLDQEVVISELSDRLTHDPFLAESLHLMLSNITAIRSAAGILKSVDDITPPQRDRFHAAIHDESKRLSDAAQALIQYFDKDARRDARTATPEEELDVFLHHHDHCFPSLDIREATNTEVDALLDDYATGLAAPTRRMALAYLETYLRDAHKMPLQKFAASARASDFNPTALASEFRCSLHAVFRRLASLKRDGIDAPTMGLQIVNAAGHAMLRNPLPDFPLPRHGNACPLWPIYQCFSQPERPLLALVQLPSGQQFITLSVALPRTTTTFGTPPDYHSAMLVAPKDQAEAFAPWVANANAVREIGTSCRICPRENCTARSEETVF